MLHGTVPNHHSSLAEVSVMVRSNCFWRLDLSSCRRPIGLYYDWEQCILDAGAKPCEIGSNWPDDSGHWVAVTCCAHILCGKLLILHSLQNLQMADLFFYFVIKKKKLTLLSLFII